MWNFKWYHFEIKWYQYGGLSDISLELKWYHIGRLNDISLELSDITLGVLAISLWN